MSRKHLLLFPGSYQAIFISVILSQANFYSIQFLKVRHFPGKIDNKLIRFLEFFLELLSRYNRLAKKSFVRFLYGAGLSRICRSPEKISPLTKKLVKLAFRGSLSGFFRSCVIFLPFFLIVVGACRSLLISKPTLCKTILSSSFVLESRTKRDKLFFLLWRHSLPKSRERQ